MWNNRRRSELLCALAPVVFSIYPIIFLYSNYIGDVLVVNTLRSLLASILVMLLLYYLCRRFTGDCRKASLITTLIAILHSSYGHLYNSLMPYYFGSLYLGQHRILLSLWILTLLLGVLVIIRRKEIPMEVIKIVNGTGLGLICFVILTISDRAIKTKIDLATVSLDPAPLLKDEVVASFRNQNTKLPDVYYIVLDSYAREDVLSRDFKFDNSEFLDFLRQKGFVTPDCACSNYSNTAMSLSTTLHMNQLETFSTTVQRGDKQRNYVIYKQFLQHNPVRGNFEKLGYRWVAFDTGCWWADILDANPFVSTNNNPINKLRRGLSLNAFEDKLLTTTSFIPVASMNLSWQEGKGFHLLTENERHYQTIISQLDQVKNSIGSRGPKFVFAHIIAPHMPFAFTAEGDYIEYPDYFQGYVNATRFINRRMEEIITQILTSSTVPPIIIIQSDHGWLTHDRMKILNAYYLPDGGSDRIYPSITPVNSFRVIFDQYFSGDYGLVPDTRRFSDQETPYTFIDIQNKCGDLPASQLSADGEKLKTHR